MTATKSHQPVNDESELARGERAAPKLDLSSLQGRWSNTNPSTAGIAEIAIEAKGGALEVRVVGVRGGKPRDWGAQPATAYAYQVNGEIVAGFELTYDFGPQETLVTAIHNRGVLVIHAYHRFKDGSGRANFISKEFFHL